MSRLAPLLCLAVAVSAGCASLNRHASRDQVTVEQDIVYVDGSQHPKHRLDFFTPIGVKDFPTVVFIHGGYWHEGDRNFYAFFSGLYSSMGDALARRGVGCVVHSYRLSPEVGIAAELEDVARAVRWTADHIAERGGAPDRIFIAGHSAGGHLAAMLAVDDKPLRAAGVDPMRIRGYIAWSPVLDLAHMRANNDADFNATVTDPVFGKDPAQLAAWSPITHARAGLPPLRILLGGKDYPYLVEQVQAAVPKLRAASWPVELVVIPGFTHEDMVVKVGGSRDLVTPAVVDFVQRDGRAVASP